MHIIVTQDQKDVIREDKVVISRKTTFWVNGNRKNYIEQMSNVSILNNKNKPIKSTTTRKNNVKL